MFEHVFRTNKILVFLQLNVLQKVLFVFHHLILHLFISLCFFYSILFFPLNKFEVKSVQQIDFFNIKLIQLIGGVLCADG